MNEMLSRVDAQQHVDSLEVINMLVHTGKVLEDRLGDALAAAGLSSTKWWALQQLIEAGEPLALSQLAERLTCVRSNATQLVDRLEAEHLVRRAPDPEDRRSIRAELTPEGYRRYQAGLEILQRLAREILTGYTPEEQRLLAHLLGRLDSQGT